MPPACGCSGWLVRPPVKRAGQQLAHDGEARALVLAHRDHRAARVLEHDGAVAADVALGDASRLSSGTGTPALFAATRALPNAILLVAMSSTTDGPPCSPGTAAQNGLVLKRASRAAVRRL